MSPIEVVLVVCPFAAVLGWALAYLIWNMRR